ncbi:MAG: hypothetical protein IJZ80_03490 [Clostridia bacterium]|nr:hypothetical protein [Clostridia bacterium]
MPFNKILKAALRELAAQRALESITQDDLDSFHFSDSFKKSMNRLFREEVGSDYIPYPEVEAPIKK